MDKDVKKMSAKEFREGGYLQEVNRQFLHPLGLALDVIIDDEGERFGSVWDYRDDPEGMLFFGIDEYKATKVEKEQREKCNERLERFNFNIQPINPED